LFFYIHAFYSAALHQQLAPLLPEKVHKWLSGSRVKVYVHTFRPVVNSFLKLVELWLYLKPKLASSLLTCCSVMHTAYTMYMHQVKHLLCDDQNAEYEWVLRKCGRLVV